MKYPLFLSREEIYNGHYSIKKETQRANLQEICTIMTSMRSSFICRITSSEGDRTNTALPLGEITVSEETLPLVHGSLVLINMFEPHQIQITCKYPYIRYCISFDSSLLLLHVQTHPIFQYFFQLRQIRTRTQTDFRTDNRSDQHLPQI